MSVNWWMNWYCNILTSTYESYWSPVSFKKSLCFATSMQHEAQGVFQMPRTPALWVASGEISQLSCRISRRDAPFLSATLGILRLYRVHRGNSTTKMAAPMKIFIRDWADIVGRSPYCNCVDSSYYYFRTSTAFLGALTYSEVEKNFPCTLGLAKNWGKLNISHVSRSEMLTSTTYRLLGHTTHTVTPIGLKFFTYVQASLLHKIAIGTTRLHLLHFSAILNFVKNTFLLTPPTRTSDSHQKLDASLTHLPGQSISQVW